MVGFSRATAPWLKLRSEQKRLRYAYHKACYQLGEAKERLEAANRFITLQSEQHVDALTSKIKGLSKKAESTRAHYAKKLHENVYGGAS